MNVFYRIPANENVVAITVSVILFCVYLTTMCPTVSFIDSGELATAATTLGIAHPTGYPLFTLLGRLVTMLPVGLEEIVKLNLFSALVTAAAMGFFFKMTLWMMESFFVGEKGKVNRRRSSDDRAIIPAAIGTLTFGLSATVWAQTVATEVYALHLLLILLTLSAFVKGLKEQKENEEQVSRHLVLSAFLLGVSFTNHMTTILLIPALFFYYAVMFGMNRSSVARLGMLSPFFFLGLSVYLYLPIRSIKNPLLDWGHPAEFERLYWHVSGKQYRSWIFSGFESAGKQFKYFGDHFPSEFHWIVIIIALFGVWGMNRRNRQLFYFWGIAFLTCVLYAINYDIHDIDSYFLLAYVAVGIALAYGIERGYATLYRTQAYWKKGAVVLGLLALPAIQWWNNHNAIDESDNHLVEDYTANILNNLDSNAVVLSYRWDYFVAPSLYYQKVKNHRPDVIIIDKELLRRSWYFIHLNARCPWLIGGSKDRVEAFLKELYKFEHDLPYNPNVIELRFVEMINDFIDKSAETRPVYLGPEIEPEFGEKFQRVPEGLVFKLVSRGSEISSKTPEIRYRSAKIENRLATVLRQSYSQMLTLNAMLLRNQNKPSQALKTLEIVNQIDPAFPAARQVGQEIINRQYQSPRTGSK